MFSLTCENDPAKVRLLTEREHLPVETARNVEMLYSDSAIVRAKITAPLLNRFDTERPYTEMPEGFELVFYDLSGMIRSRLSALYGISYTQEGRMEARRNVILVNEKGEKLNTEHLIWEEKTEKIFTEEFVRITTAEEVILGTGLEANQNFTWFKVKNIRGTIAVKE